MIPSSAASTGSAHTRPVNVSPRCSDGLSVRPAFATLTIDPLLSRDPDRLAGTDTSDHREPLRFARIVSRDDDGTGRREALQEIVRGVHLLEVVDHRERALALELLREVRCVRGEHNIAIRARHDDDLLPRRVTADRDRRHVLADLLAAIGQAYAPGGDCALHEVDLRRLDDPS